MDIQRFDRIAKLFAARRTRRAALSSGMGLAAAAALAPRLGHVAAQDATPAAGDTPAPFDPHPSADTPAKTEFLFVQPFAGGTWAPKPGEEGVLTLTLTGTTAHTVYFSDRPERIFGLAHTQQFLDGLGFTPNNPPNAALLAHTDSGDQEILVIELFNPVFDEATGTLTYDAKILADYTGTGLAHAARQQSDFSLPESFGEGGLFIDDCADHLIQCRRDGKVVGEYWQGRCFKPFNCDYCQDPKRVCASKWGECFECDMWDDQHTVCYLPKYLCDPVDVS